MRAGKALFGACGKEGGFGNLDRGKWLVKVGHSNWRTQMGWYLQMGMVLYGNRLSLSIQPFFVFSDYQKPAVRIASLSNIQNFFIWTHDSIGVGEDGPTHEPIEHLTQFRALPNFYVWDQQMPVKMWSLEVGLR